MTKISASAQRLGVVDHMDKVLAMALGAGETTVFKLAGAYAAFVNGGKKIEPHLIELVQDREGKTILRADKRDCRHCDAGFNGDESPRIPAAGAQVWDPITAYQITSMLQGVVQRGTATQASVLGRPVGGKTGTTNDYRSAWFMGFTPQIVVGVFVGFDDNRSLGRGETGSQAAVPIFVDFMQEAIKGYAPEEFKAPSNAKFAMVRGIREAFRPGTEPKVAMDATLTPVAGPQPYDKVWQNGVTGAPNAGAAVAPPPPPKKPTDDVTGLY
jgi:penicillin-binding protein 1A